MENRKQFTRDTILTFAFVLTLVAVLLWASHSWADTTRRTIGNTDFYQSSDGRTATGTQIGNTYFVRDYGNGLAGEVATK